jgi:hypothetical protein
LSPLGWPKHGTVSAGPFNQPVYFNHKTQGHKSLILQRPNPSRQPNTHRQTLTHSSSLSPSRSWRLALSSLRRRIWARSRSCTTIRACRSHAGEALGSRSTRSCTCMREPCWESAGEPFGPFLYVYAAARLLASGSSCARRSRRLLSNRLIGPAEGPGSSYARRPRRLLSNCLVGPGEGPPVATAGRDGGGHRPAAHHEGAGGRGKTFFFGGHETTTLALSWMLLMLVAHPD